MAYSQEELVRCMREGDVLGEAGKPKYVETVLSHIFLFEERVYKLCKNDNAFANRTFRDMRVKKDRFDFVRRDFSWNRSLSPTIYAGLIGVVVREGILCEVRVEEAEELLMVMHRVADEDILFEKLLAGEIAEQDAFSLGKQLAILLKKGECEKRSVNFFENFRVRVEDLRQYGRATGEVFAKESGGYCDFLDAFSESNKYWFETELTEQSRCIGDLHGCNAVYREKELALIDTFMPKEVWTYGHFLLSVYTLGVDIWAISGERSFFEAYLRGYEEGSGVVIDRDLDIPFVLYGATLRAVAISMFSLHDASKEVAAKKYRAFAQEFFEKNCRDLS